MIFACLPLSDELGRVRGLQVGLVAAVTAAAHGVGEATSALVDFTLPTFAVAFLVGLLIRTVLQRTPAWSYTDARTIKSLSGVSTDVLIVCGIASIVPRFVADAWLPLAICRCSGWCSSRPWCAGSCPG